MEGQTGEAWGLPKRSDVFWIIESTKKERKYMICFMQTSKC
jgi:hypothetical protein